jgi:Flp pilus assembly protein TadB
MDPIIAEVYSTVMPSAPYVVAAYVLIWAALLVFVVAMFRRTRRTQKDIDALREALEYREGKRADGADEE